MKRPYMLDVHIYGGILLASAGAALFHIGAGLVALGLLLLLLGLLPGGDP